MATIMVIEDDEGTRSLLARALKREGYEVVEAADGRVAQGQMAARQPDLVITDIVMPNCDGIEFIHYMRSLERRVPIVAVSGGGRLPAGGYLDMARLSGAVAVFTKPFDLGALMASLRTLLPQRA
jgi:DNA-binding response OmpR family regulator